MKSTALEKQVAQSLWVSHVIFSKQAAVRCPGRRSFMDFCHTLVFPTSMLPVVFLQRNPQPVFPYVTAECCSQCLLFDGKDAEDVSSF